MPYTYNIHFHFLTSGLGSPPVYPQNGLMVGLDGGGEPSFRGRGEGRGRVGEEARSKGRRRKDRERERKKREGRK